MNLQPKLVVDSTRPGPVAPMITRWVETIALDHAGFDVEPIDLAELALSLPNEPAQPRHQRNLSACRTDCARVWPAGRSVL